MPLDAPKIILIGNIPKGDEERQKMHDWRSEYLENLKSRIPTARFLDADMVSDSIGPELVVGHDLWLVKHADIVVANASMKIGAGTAQEMMFAKYCRKPLVTILPKDTHHRRSNLVFHGTVVTDWIHPFIFVASDHIAESIDGVSDWILSYLKNQNAVIKDITVFDAMIDRFDLELHDITDEYKKQGW